METENITLLTITEESAQEQIRQAVLNFQNQLIIENDSVYLSLKTLQEIFNELEIDINIAQFLYSKQFRDYLGKNYPRHLTEIDEWIESVRIPTYLIHHILVVLAEIGESFAIAYTFEKENNFLIDPIDTWNKTLAFSNPHFKRSENPHPQRRENED
jgi:hypothetical protein